MIDRSNNDPATLLRWYLEAGADEAIGEYPVDRFSLGESPGDFAATPTAPSAPAAAAEAVEQGLAAAAPARRPALAAAPSAATGGAAVANAVALAEQASTLDDVRAALHGFTDCPLSRTATNLVFGDGDSNADVLLIGEGPGAEEDRRGLPFVGPSGRLLDKMLASINLQRDKVFITNTIFWRPPGNRSPTSAEVAACMPFVERIVELVDPELVIALGGPAAAALLGHADSVGRLRGRWFTYQTARMTRPIAATAIFHPAYLLRSPAQKRLAWRDLLAIKNRIIQG